MSFKNHTCLSTEHRFLDEAGDTTFYGKGKIQTIGEQGVSNSFILGMVSFKEQLETIRLKICELQKQVQTDAYFKDVPSIQKKIQKNGFYFHATDDIPEVRKLFFDYIKSIDCSFQAVVGRKSVDIYEKKHNGRENEFYADLLSHLLTDKLCEDGKLVINIAARGKSTRNANLELALKKAIHRYQKLKEKEITTSIVFNVQTQYTEPLLNIADYFCWVIQRVFERGETRYYNFLMEKIPMVIDLYGGEKTKDGQNYYGRENPLSAKNKISPPLH